MSSTCDVISDRLQMASSRGYRNRDQHHPMGPHGSGRPLLFTYMCQLCCSWFGLGHIPKQLIWRSLISVGLQDMGPLESDLATRTWI